MICTGWNNGTPNNKTGAGYGLRISRKDRDKYFKRFWGSIEIELENGELVAVNLSSSFRKDCIELRSSRIGKWMLENGYAPWPKEKPPKFKLIPVGERRFKLLPIDSNAWG